MTKIQFEKDTCGRCGGSGQMPYAAYGGVCFGCNGKGENLTPAGRVAYRRVQKIRAELLTVKVEDLKPGQRFDSNGKLKTVESVTSYATREEALKGAGCWMEGGIVHVVTQKSSISFPPNHTVILQWTPEAIEVAAKAVARLKGATVTQAEETAR